MYIGTDIVKISRIDGLIQNTIPLKVFTKSEISYIETKSNKSQTTAGIFAAKEAVLKCLGTGLRLPLGDICVMHKSSGEPYIVLCEKAKSYANSLGIYEIEISISHDGEYAIAAALANVDVHLKLYSRAINRITDTVPGAITAQDIASLLPKRKEDTHKGDYGRLFVLAGSEGLTGAAIMACTSALRCGAGLITLGCSQELNVIFESAMPEVMTKPLKSHNGIINLKDINLITDSINKSDICLAGPGLGRTDDITDIVSHIIQNTKVPCVLDADGIYALSKNPGALKDRKCPLILTPHIGEFACLTGLSTEDILANPEETARAFAKEHALTLVLKSHKTLVCTKDGEVFRNLLGNPGMATGGSGDVLAGCIASFLSQGRTMEDAAKLGVYIHSLSADMAALQKGEYSLTPSDIIDFLPYAIKYSEEM